MSSTLSTVLWMRLAAVVAKNGKHHTNRSSVAVRNSSSIVHYRTAAATASSSSILNAGSNGRVLAGVHDNKALELENNTKRCYSTAAVAFPHGKIGSAAAKPDHFLQQQQQVRWKNAGKMKKHLENLDEMAHTKSREHAEERRKKQKEKKATKQKQTSTTTTAAAAGVDHDDDEEEDAHSPQKQKHKQKHDTDHDHDDDDDHHDDDEEEEGDAAALPDPIKAKARMMKHVVSFVDSLKSIRGGEPTPEIFESILVDAGYGGGSDNSTSLVPIKTIAQVVISSSTLAHVNCYDPALAKPVATALQQKLGFNSEIQQGGVVRVDIPRLSLERRHETAKALAKRAENYRQRIRRVRRTLLERVKKGVAGKLEHVSKDDAFRVQQEIEAATETVIAELNKAADQKHASVMAM